MLAAEVTREDLLKACESLFGPEIDVSTEFLRYLKPSGVKVAYRKKAMETHPDRAGIVQGASDLMEQRFKEVNFAYQLLQDFLTHPWKYSLDESGVIHKRRRTYSSPSNVDRKTHPEKSEPFYRGRIPSRKLLFGQYLYYSGQVTFSAMIKAVVWQRLQRPSIGAMALSWGWMDGRDVMDILRRRRFGERFGDCALRFGYLSETQIGLLLNQQRKIQPVIGKYFVDQRLMDSARLFRCLVAMKIHNNQYPSY